MILSPEDKQALSEIRFAKASEYVLDRIDSVRRKLITDLLQ